ncbi:MAG: glycosyltransferase [Pyrinomonadaceae bacterium]|nr:glycosyltransferase [Phycisphaerales bacterium]
MSSHVIICTHTTRHLARTLLGVACQTVTPDSVLVSCDNDAADIAELTRECSQRFSLRITLVQRPHQGASRSSQVRNNAVRALIAGPHHQTDRLWFLDGDCCPAPDALAVHEKLGDGNRLVVGFRVDLTPEQTDLMSEDIMRQGLWPIQPTHGQFAQLQSRHRRYVRAAWIRRLGLCKPHKPKLLSANFSVSLQAYLNINGFDEEYTGYGQEDDDLGRRLYKAGVLPVVGVASAMVFHQYHPTRAPGAWLDSPNAARFLRPFRARCLHGVENPAAQPEPIITLYAPPVRGDVSAAPRRPSPHHSA